MNDIAKILPWGIVSNWKQGDRREKCKRIKKLLANIIKRISAPLTEGLGFEKENILEVGGEDSLQPVQ